MATDQDLVGRVPERRPARLVAANSAWQLLTFAARAVAGLGVVVLLARSGGPRSLGVFQFALTLTGMLPYFYGVPSLLAREVARRPQDARRWVDAGTLITLVAGALLTVLVTVGAIAVGAPRETVAALAVASTGMSFDGLARVQFAGFWASERMDREAVVTVVQEAVFLVAAAAVLAAGGDAFAALVTFSASRALGAGLGWLLVARQLGGLSRPRATTAFLRSTVRQSTPFMVNDTLTLAYMRADSVMLGVVRGPAAVGLYQAGTNLVLYWNVLARSINRALYPRMSRAWPHRLAEFRRLCTISFATINLVAVPVTVASFLLAPRTFALLYGPAFAPAVLTYQLLVLVIPVRMLGNTLSLSLSATDRQARRTVAVAAAAVLNVGLNLYLIPRYSYLGAAVTTLVCELSLLAVYVVLQRQVAGGSPLLRTAALPLLASGPMALAILTTGTAHLVVSALLGAVTYAAGLLVLGTLRVPPGSPHRPAAALAALTRPAP